MIIKSNVNKNYIGPKALFDPNYVPPRLLYRKKEENSLHSILNDILNFISTTLPTIPFKKRKPTLPNDHMIF